MLRHDHPQTSATYAAAELWNCDWQRSRPSGARCNRAGDGNRRTRTGALRVQTRAQDVDARASGVAPTAVMLWKKSQRNSLLTMTQLLNLHTRSGVRVSGRVPAGLRHRRPIL